MCRLLLLIENRQSIRFVLESTNRKEGGVSARRRPAGSGRRKNMNDHRKAAIFCLLSGALLAKIHTGHATLARMDFSIGGQPPESVYLQLLDEAAPLTTANFLAYIQAGRYQDTFIHRAVDVDTAGVDVIQGGGFTFQFDQQTGSGFYTPVDTFAPVPNEYDPAHPNRRGTLAMARTQDPDSATSQWYFNVVDNPLPGFTVFGEVLSGMNTIDAIAALPTVSIQSPITDLPLVNFQPGDTVNFVADNIVMLTGIAASPYPLPLFVDPAPLTFDPVIRDSGPVTRDVEITNLGDSSVVIGGIDPAGSLTGPFSLSLPATGACNDGMSLAPLEQCRFTLEFAPLQAGDFASTFSISYDDGSVRSLSYEVSGSREDSFLVLPNTSEDGFIDVGETVVGQTVQLDSDLGGLPFGNQGDQALNFTSITLSGPDAAQFSIDTNNCDILQAGGICLVGLSFTPDSSGVKQATLEVRTDDVPAFVTLALRGIANSENDGIGDLEEAGAPNNGDGNLDGIPDALQENVTSLRDTRGRYVTIEAPAGTRLQNVQAINDPSAGNLPQPRSGSINFPNDFFAFVLDGLEPGGAATVNLYLPTGSAPNSYFKFTPWLPDPAGGYTYTGPNSLFWNVFDFDPTTSTGAIIDGNRITLHLVDGARGDADGTPNGQILDPGGPGILTAADSSSSGGGGCTLGRNTTPPAPVGLVLILLFSITGIALRPLIAPPGNGRHCRPGKTRCGLLDTCEE
ncbi:MAG TPA: choice-of-anchor D domain-containing protein [Gammaproteobacteria bacterium]|nr:choice-of-anchor D domain-containing protein [Gammaproteobacteria bacterium]